MSVRTLHKLVSELLKCLSEHFVMACFIYSAKACSTREEFAIANKEQSRQSSGLYYKHITIVNDDSRVVSERRSKVWHHLRALLMTLAKAKAKTNETFIVQASLMSVT